MSDLVYLKTMTFQGGLKTHKLKQLKPRCIGLYPPVERIGAVDCSYIISSVSDFHDVVHVSSLRKVGRGPKLILQQPLSAHGKKKKKLYAPCQPIDIINRQVKEVQEMMTMLFKCC